MQSFVVEKIQLFKWFLSALLLSGSCVLMSVDSQVCLGMCFPQLDLYDGEGASQFFSSEGKQLVFLGFSRKVKEELLLWHKALLREKKIINGVHRMVVGVLPSWMSWGGARKPILALCKRFVPKEALPYFRFTFFEKEKLSPLLDTDQGDTFEHIHVFYLDADRKITWYASGRPSPEHVAQLQTLAKSLKN